MTEREALKLALEKYMAAFGQALEAYGIELQQQQIEADRFAREALAQSELCKYGQEPKSCTSSPMDCQCALDATFAQTEQEPVAWQVEVLIQGVWSPMGNPQRDKSRAEKLAANPSIPKDCQRVIELYTTPPQRTWVGLTKNEVYDLYDSDYAVFHQRIEAKLKEKNNG